MNYRKGKKAARILREYEVSDVLLEIGNDNIIVTDDFG